MSAAVPRPKILVVDDTAANRLAMRRLLQKIDADLIEASSGEEALSACLDHSFALILLDINMPGMDGFEVASLLQGEASTRDMPIIFLTAAYGDDLSRLKGYEVGAVDFITKPVHSEVLLSKVRVFLELHRQRHELQRHLEQMFQLSLELKHAKAQLQHQAQSDGLTGLPNRRLFHQRLDDALARSTRQQSTFALLYLDIDGFKDVNDQHGHAAGDALLQTIAQRLQERLRQSDFVARLGGDEFAVIAESLDGPEGALQLANDLCQRLAEPYHLDDVTQPVTSVGASIGIALYPTHASTTEALIRIADGAMYQAKHAGRRRAVLATPSP